MIYKAKKDIIKCPHCGTKNTMKFNADMNRLEIKCCACERKYTFYEAKNEKKTQNQ